MSKRPHTGHHDRPVTETGDSDAFLSRWARRKRAARSGGDPEAVSPEAPAPADPPVSAATREVQESPEDPPGDEDMPSLDNIDAGTDMSGFFSPKVSEAVKKAALRKFFHSPAFNVVDGLDDYDDDFRTFEALGDIVTSDMRGRMEREAEATASRAPADADPVPPDETEPGSAAADATPEEPVEGESDQADPEVAETAGRGVTREPGGAAASVAHGKLRPRSPEGGEEA